MNFPLFDSIPAKVYKIDASKERQKFLLLRNESGPVIQSVFDEIDVRMIEVKPGKKCHNSEMFVLWKKFIFR